MRDSLRTVIESIRGNPVGWSEAIRLTVLLATGFGMWHMTTEQQALLMAALSGWLSVITRGHVVANSRVDQKVDERVAHREMTGTTGTGSGMSTPARTSTSGTC